MSRTHLLTKTAVVLLSACLLAPESMADSLPAPAGAKSEGETSTTLADLVQVAAEAEPERESVAQSLQAPKGTDTSGAAGVPQSWRWTLGAGAGIAPDYEGSDDYDVVPIPVVRGQKRYWFGQLFGTHVTSNFIDHPAWRLGLSANYRPGYSEAENNRVDRLNDRGNSFEVGIKGGYVLDLQQARPMALDFSLEFLHDVTSGHEGWVLTPSIDFDAQLADKWGMSAGIEAAYASGNYMSHFFSINSDDASDSGLDNYDADSDFKHVAFNLGVKYDISSRWGLNVLGQYKRMVGDAEDSPVIDDVGEENQFFGGLVISYSWGGG